MADLFGYGTIHLALFTSRDNVLIADIYKVEQHHGRLCCAQSLHSPQPARHQHSCNLFGNSSFSSLGRAAIRSLTTPHDVLR